MNLGKVSNRMKDVNRILLTELGLAPHCLRDGRIMVKIGELGIRDFYCCETCENLLVYDTGGHFMYIEGGEWER